MMDYNTLIILQARMSSSRLPNKVLKPILGKPMLAHQIDRLSRVKTPHKLIIATSDDSSDDAIEELCTQIKVECFRGSLNDVLARYYQAALKYNDRGTIRNIVRITGDCPVIDAKTVDNVISFFQDQGVDYCSNCNPATFPDGLDVEVFTFASLQKAYQESTSCVDREHVTPFIADNSNLFTRANFAHSTDISHHRWTVDELADFKLVNLIYQALYPKNPDFDLQDILALLDAQPELTQINDHIVRNEGLQKTIASDEYLAEQSIREK